MRSLYDGMLGIVVTPTWAELIDFETTPPSAVEELARQRDGGGSVGLTLQHKNRAVLVAGPEIEIVRVRTRHLTAAGPR